MLDGMRLLLLVMCQVGKKVQSVFVVVPMARRAEGDNAVRIVTSTEGSIDQVRGMHT